MILLGLMSAGGAMVDQITQNMLPITARHFTDNIGLISFMVALNRLCGVLVMPYAAWKSDRTRSRWGRRRPFLLIGWPATLLSLGLLGAMPFLIPPGEYRHGIAIVCVFTANLFMQVWIDVSLGASETIYGDQFDRRELGRASGVKGAIANVAGILMGAFAIPAADRNEFIPYAAVMGLLFISWMVAALWLKEQVPIAPPPPDRYRPWSPLLLLRNREVARSATLVSCAMLATALNVMLLALFVTETLGLTKTNLGYSQAVYVTVCVVLGVPAGHLMDRFGLRRVMVVAFALYGVAALGLAFLTHDALSLYLWSGLLAAGQIATNTAVLPLMVTDTGGHGRGAVFGSLQVTRALLAAVAMIVVGQIANALGSYRVCFIAGALFCAIGAFVAWRSTRPGAAENPAPSPAR